MADATAPPAPPPPAPEDAVAYDKVHYPDGLNANFLVEDAENLEAKYGGATGKFTNPETRDIAGNLDDIMAALGDLTGMAVADIGAGTGLFLPRLSKAVGPTGHVYANEISPGFLTLLRRLQEKDGLAHNTTVLQGTVTDTGLPPDVRVDLVFFCDVYHHIEFPVTYMQKVRASMKPGGRVVLIDFHRIPEKIWSHPPEWVLEHVRAGQDVFTQEVLQAGLVLEREVNLPNLRENYFLVFTNPASS